MVLGLLPISDSYIYCGSEHGEWLEYMLYINNCPDFQELSEGETKFVRFDR